MLFTGFDLIGQVLDADRAGSGADRDRSGCRGGVAGGARRVNRTRREPVRCVHGLLGRPGTRRPTGTRRVHRRRRDRSWRRSSPWSPPGRTTPGCRRARTTTCSAWPATWVRCAGSGSTCSPMPTGARSPSSCECDEPSQQADWLAALCRQLVAELRRHHRGVAVLDVRPGRPDRRLRGPSCRPRVRHPPRRCPTRGRPGRSGGCRPRPRRDRRAVPVGGSRPGQRRAAALGSTIHLHSTDVDGEWLVGLGAGWSRDHPRARQG